MSKTLPDPNGHFGIFGGRYAAETLMPALIELEKGYQTARKDKNFQRELEWYQREYAGRATPLYYARRMSEALHGAKIYLKREDLNHTGSHKINNTLGQALLARRMGKKKVIAETGAGQHGGQRQQLRRSSAWNAKSLWAKKISAAKHPMCSG